MKVAFEQKPIDKTDKSIIRTGDLEDLCPYELESYNKYWGLENIYAEAKDIRVMDTQTEEFLTELQLEYRTLRAVANRLEEEAQELVAHRFHKFRKIKRSELPKSF